jgi:deoxyribose-phosphate aldolase
MVTNLSLLKDKRYASTPGHQGRVEAVRGSGIIVKAILETSLLDEHEIRAACACAAEAGVNYARPPPAGRAAAADRHQDHAWRAAARGRGQILGLRHAQRARAGFFAFLLGADVLGSPRATCWWRR